MTHVLLILIYIAFISLGLPDALLGAAWPTIYPDFNVPVSYAGIISMIIAAGTIVSSVCSDRLTFHLGTGKVTAFSVATTAVALLGFSFTHSFWGLRFWALHLSVWVALPYIPASSTLRHAISVLTGHRRLSACRWPVPIAAAAWRRRCLVLWESSSLWRCSPGIWFYSCC